MHEPVELKLEQVSKIFAKVEKEGVIHALRDLNLRMQSGEFISLVGPSGCGKSTILRLIAGLIFPTEGTLSVNGQPVTKPAPERGMVFQNPTLFPWLTVEKNIGFSDRMTGQTNPDKVDRMIRLIGLDGFQEDYPKQLSGGMAQRVALARSIIREPEILLLDEPLGALDAFTRMNMQSEILEVWERTKPLFIMVTHDIDEALYMSTRILVMDANPGRIKADIPIDMDYPRNRSSSVFVDYRNQILEMLHYGKKDT